MASSGESMPDVAPGGAARNGKPNGAANGIGHGQSHLPKLPTSDEKLLRKCVLDLVALIQNPETLRALIASPAFEERLKGMGDKQAKRRVGLMLDALPKTEALLEPIDSSGVRFRWQYDLHGFAIASDSSLERVRKCVDDFHALAREVDEPLRKLGIGLEFVESRLSLMQYSMKWPEAVRLARRLEAATGIGEAATEMIGEAVALEEYTAVAVAAVPRIAQAIAISKVLAPQKVFTDALPSVAEGLELSLLPNEKRAPRVSGAWTALLQSLGGSAPATPDGVRGFSEMLSKLLLDVGALAGPAATAWQASYFDNWRARLLERIARTALLREPSWADVAMLLSRDGEQTQMHKAWSTNAASIWTEIALSGMTGAAASDRIVYPRWAAPYAFALLGVPALAIATTSSHDAVELRPTMHERKDWHDRRFVVVISADPSALNIPSWTVSESCAALVVSRTQLGDLAACITPLAAVFSTRDPWLIVEGTESDGPLPPESLLDSSLPGPWLSFWQPSRRLQIFSREPPKRSALSVVAAAALQAFRSTPRYVVGARNIDEAVSKADRLETPNSQSPAS